MQNLELWVRQSRLNLHTEVVVAMDGVHQAHMRWYNTGMCRLISGCGEGEKGTRLLTLSTRPVFIRGHEVDESKSPSLNSGGMLVLGEVVLGR